MHLYIHIPFCSSKCKYCRFSSFVEQEEIKRKYYIEYLKKTIESYKGGIREIKTIYFGGGSPSSLTGEYIREIMFCLEKKFIISKNREITLEVNPKDITQEKLQFYLSIGINRFSLGIQSLNFQTLKEIGRDKKKTIFFALDNFEKLYKKNISLDFIIGLPYQKKGQVKKDIQTLLKKYPFIKHISLYMLEDYYYSKSWKKISIKEEDFLKEYTQTKNFLEEEGFGRYEISNFAKKGYKCKHNLAYWNHSDMIAFGLGAHGYEQGKRYAYPDNFTDYYRGKLQFEEELEEKEKILETIMFSLRTTGIQKSYFCFLDEKKLDYFFEKGFLEKKKNKIIVSEKGVLVIDFILKEIIK
ncbi:radical SAM family heme chaperone HemW [Candidatus Gracilibacteria bacterium]|nr:radical SAM family heme chaperone HemW [Candidatus Gracilibacteria bacterium]NUJ99440.1 radical SAM family heme chaperone HemW [Candidatus Gracilibacteria bacterium]